MSSLVAAALADGFVQVVRRRFLVATSNHRSPEEIRIVEVRADPSGFHVVVKRGRIGHYETRQIERFVSFANVEAAIARVDAVETELLSADFLDLRTRLAACKAPSPATFF